MRHSAMTLYGNNLVNTESNCPSKSQLPCAEVSSPPVSISQPRPASPVLSAPSPRLVLPPLHPLPIPSFSVAASPTSSFASPRPSGAAVSRTTISTRLHPFITHYLPWSPPALSSLLMKPRNTHMHTGHSVLSGASKAVGARGTLPDPLAVYALKPEPRVQGVVHKAASMWGSGEYHFVVCAIPRRRISLGRTAISATGAAVRTVYVLLTTGTRSRCSFPRRGYRIRVCAMRRGLFRRPSVRFVRDNAKKKVFPNTRVSQEQMGNVIGVGRRFRRRTKNSDSQIYGGLLFPLVFVKSNSIAMFLLSLDPISPKLIPSAPLSNEDSIIGTAPSNEAPNTNDAGASELSPRQVLWLRLHVQAFKLSKSQSFIVPAYHLEPHALENGAAKRALLLPTTILMTCASSSVTNPGQSFAKSQTKPMTPISASHPLLKSSRGRVPWPDQRPLPSEKKHGAALDDGLGESAMHQTRQRTSSVTSVETIRLRVKTRAADALLNTRKRTHSAISPEVDDDDSSALQTGPRVRQRKGSNSAAVATSPAVDEPVAKARMSSALKKLKDKFTPPQTAEVSDVRPSFPTTSTSSVVHPDNTSAQSQFVPSQQTIGTRSTAATAAPEFSSLAPAHPLRFLPTNTESKRAPIRLPIAGSHLTKYNCYELDASEYSLAISFPSSSQSNFEVWENELFFVGPLSLHLTLKDPGKWDNLPISHPEVSVLELTCTSKPVVDAPTYPYCAAATAESNKYHVRYAGAKTRSPAGVLRAVEPARGIAVDTVWIKTNGAHTRTRYDAGDATQRGWSMEFFVPIATRLFEKRETRAFQVDALISVWALQLAADAATMSVSHLMREREMVRRRACEGRVLFLRFFFFRFLYGVVALVARQYMTVEGLRPGIQLNGLVAALPLALVQRRRASLLRRYKPRLDSSPLTPFMIDDLRLPHPKIHVPHDLTERLTHDLTLQDYAFPQKLRKRVKTPPTYSAEYNLRVRTLFRRVHGLDSTDEYIANGHNMQRIVESECFPAVLPFASRREDASKI
ncbi:hypothetical protein C8R44DRAFT_738272 [Mycena epipterygia]|nr:hypothetical protein C8R44DRAFT_738272 [Mycena epipterygia]